MRITILSHHLGLQGSYLNILDFQSYLQEKGYKVLFYTQDKKDLFNVVRGSRRPYRFDDVKNIKQYKPDPLSTIVTDFKTLIKLWKNNSRIVCNKLIIMDNNELSYHLNDMRDAKFFHKNIFISRLIKAIKYNEVLFLMPPSNIDKFKYKYPDIPFKIFFKKINWNMLRNVCTSNRDKLYFRFDDVDDTKEIIEKYGENVITFKEYQELDLWAYKGMIYRRRKHLDYYEQLGRLIFEFIMLGKEVHFMEEPNEVPDGLNDYLKHYNIKFDENFKVITPAKDLRELMTMDYGFKPWEEF